MTRSSTPSRYRARTPSHLMEAGVPVTHLQIGQCIITSRNVLISTVLGSCVSATFHHRASGLSAMFHAMLPEKAMDRMARSPCKFVDSSIELIAERYARDGLAPESVEVKLFGGGFTIEPERKQHLRAIVDVGARNAERAIKDLSSLGYKVMTSNILGDRGRKLYFHTATGEVWMKTLEPTLMLAEMERRRKGRDRD